MPMPKKFDTDKDIIELIKKDPKLVEFLLHLDYKEKPIDIMQFIEDPLYLGNATDRGKKIYPIWKDTLKEVFTNNDIFEVIMTGSTGTGKSSVAQIGMAYSLYTVLNMVNPWDYFGLLVGKPLSFVFFSITLSLTSSTNFMAFQNQIQTSDWFKSKGVLRGNVAPILYFDGIDYKLASPRCAGKGILGADIISGTLDEINAPSEPLSIKKRAFDMYQAVVRRIESRFLNKGVLPGLKLFLCASKDDELSFLDAHINKRKHSKNVLIKDIAIWEAKPQSYSGKKFSIAVGDAFKTSRIIEENEVAQYIKDGYTIVRPPIEHRETFEYSLIEALRDIAGITVQGIRKYKLFPSEKFIQECIIKDSKDPVTNGTITTGLQDEVNWIDYIDLNRLMLPLSVPRCGHLDIAISGDAMAIAFSGVKEWVLIDKQDESGVFRPVQLPIVMTDLILRIKSKSGDRIPLHKMRKLIIDLRNSGMNIKKFTADLRLASEDTIQILNKAGIPTEYFSVDKSIKPYMDFRNLIFEHRWLCYTHPWLYFELKHLEHDRDRNRIDHPQHVSEIEVLLDGSLEEKVGLGSKDCSDAVCGSVLHALLLAKVPIDPTKLAESLKEMNQRPEDRIPLPPDWFLSESSKKTLRAQMFKSPEGSTILNRSDKSQKMLDAIKSVEEINLYV